MKKNLYFFIIFSLLLIIPNGSEGSVEQEGRRARSPGSFNFQDDELIADSIETFSDYDESEEDTLTENYFYEVRRPSEDFLDQFKKLEDFNYKNVENPEGFFEIIGAWLREQFIRLLFSEGFYYFREYLEYIIAILAIAIVVYILLKSKLGGVVYGKGEQRIKRIKESEEDITKIDLDKLIADAVSKGNYRIAIRYYYLKILKALSDKNLIDWKINKTNYDYLYELKEPNLKKLFADLTYLFEWIWYGEIPVEEKLYSESVKFFTKFQSDLTEKR